MLKVSILYAVWVNDLVMRKKCTFCAALKGVKRERVVVIQKSGKQESVDAVGLSDQTIEVGYVGTVAGKFGEGH